MVVENAILLWAVGALAGRDTVIDLRAASEASLPQASASDGKPFQHCRKNRLHPRVGLPFLRRWFKLFAKKVFTAGQPSPVDE